MIRMVDKDGDGQVAYSEFYRMVTGGKKPPPGQGHGGKHGRKNSNSQNAEKLSQTLVGSGATIPPPTGQDAIKARNEKRKLLNEFSRDNNLKPESIKRAHRRFMALDQKKTGKIDYTELCEILQVDPSPQCEEVFEKYDYQKSGLIDAKEILIALANFTGAGKDDK